VAGNAKLPPFSSFFGRFEAWQGELMNFSQLPLPPLELSQGVPI
jgi:hypothetical protein